MFPGKLILSVGIVSMLVTGYYAMIHRETLRLLQQEFTGLPFPLLLSLIASSLMCIIGGLSSAGTLKPISVAENLPPSVPRPRHIDFVTFNNRGPLLGLISKSNAAASQN